MDRLCRAIAVFSVVVSIAAFILALWGGGMLLAMQDLLTAVGLMPERARMLDYPLGMWALALYACGVLAGLYALRYPMGMGLAMLPLGACALLLGGPVAHVWGTIFVLIGIVLVVLSMLQGAGRYRIGPE